VYKLEELKLSGPKTAIYSIVMNQENLYKRFLLENNQQHLEELLNINLRLKTIASETGPIEDFFKPNQGNYDDKVCYLYDDPERFLRLYCIRFDHTVILGGGGYKPREIRALQEDPKLKQENSIVREVSQLLHERLKKGLISWSIDGKHFKGDLTF
jgi:hypothetical protein